MAKHSPSLPGIMDSASPYLTDRLLVAMPSVQDGCFDRAVVYVCSHDEEGAMGVIVNAGINSIDLKEVLEQLSITAQDVGKRFPVQFGGPVEAHRGFVLHSTDYVLPDSVVHPSGVALTANVEILRAIADGKGPQSAALMLGYAGWSSGQLENEIESGSWIIAPADKGVIFGADNDIKWSRAAALLGIADFSQLSYTVGHA